MQILLANAKIMHEHTDRQPTSVPRFQSISNVLAAEMARMDTDELAASLGCSPKIAATNLQRFQQFPFAEKMPALLAYNGQAYKHLRADTLSDDELAFAQQHLWITCFLYGLLRPMDGVAPYRMEHYIALEATDDRPLHQFWRDKLTDVLIESVRADDGVLVHLSTAEYEQLFDWQRVCRELQVVHPLFYVRQPNGRLKVQAVWAKTCRGAMVRYILKHRISPPTCKALPTRASAMPRSWAKQPSPILCARYRALCHGIRAIFWADAPSLHLFRIQQVRQIRDYKRKKSFGVSPNHY